MSFVAVSRVSYPIDLKQEMHATGLAMLPVARHQDGFISVAFHQCIEKNETMMYWEWESRADHEKCMQSKDWNAIMEKNGALFARDDVQFSIETYERLG